MKSVRFGMEWKCYGMQEIDLPDHVDANDMDAVRDYISSVWGDIPLPDGEYVGESGVLDEDNIEVRDFGD